LSDYRKHITKESKGKGPKRRIWEKHFEKELDTKFYSRLLKDVKSVRFEFMETHKEIKEFFKNEDRVKCFGFDEIPVTEFLARGHVWLYRTSQLWEDNYPRVHAEALAAGLPCLVEPRYGTLERTKENVGSVGYLCTHYDEFQLHLKTFLRKEKFRQDMGLAAKEYALNNLKPEKWIEVIEEALSS
jgi:glycosyltransferase involved in cell wall biosynthesis